jgi:hypothetical protein
VQPTERSRVPELVVSLSLPKGGGGANERSPKKLFVPFELFFGPFVVKSERERERERVDVRLSEMLGLQLCALRSPANVLFKLFLCSLCTILCALRGKKNLLLNRRKTERERAKPHPSETSVPYGFVPYLCANGANVHNLLESNSQNSSCPLW